MRLYMTQTTRNMELVYNSDSNWWCPPYSDVPLPVTLSDSYSSNVKVTRMCWARHINDSSTCYRLNSCLRTLFTGHGDEKHAVHRLGVRAERRNVW